MRYDNKHLPTLISLHGQGYKQAHVAVHRINASNLGNQMS
jgi:hypothetical protein